MTLSEFVSSREIEGHAQHTATLVTTHHSCVFVVRYQDKTVGYDSNDYQDPTSQSETGVQGSQDTPFRPGEQGELSQGFDSISMWRERNAIMVHVRHWRLSVRRFALTSRWDSARGNVALRVPTFTGMQE